MPKAKNPVSRHRKHKRIMKRAKGYWGARSNTYRCALEAVAKGEKYATIHRKLRKRDFRRLWLQRISAACRQHGTTYSQFINGLRKARIELNRKMLAEIAARDSRGFEQVIKKAQASL